MTNIDKLSEALAEWGMNVAKSVLPNVKIPPQSGIGSFMQMLGVDIRTYNIYDELGFLLKPTMRRFIQPTLVKYLGGMTDAEVEEVAMEYVEAMREKANERGYVNLFGIQVGANAFDGLKDILTDKFNE
ncbi:MAG: hypothetical protein U0K81_06130 [Paludibacteraceae bacterium]|nr:hypothetical protein [Paludibacteraceae bacterium]